MRREYFGSFVLLAAILLSAGSIQALAQKKTVKKKPVLRKAVVTKKAPAAPKTYAVDSGTRIRVRINSTLSSKVSQVGDKFTANVTEPVYSNTGVLVIPAGSVVTGKVDSVKRAEEHGRPGQIGVSFISIKTPSGYTRAINGSLTDLDSKSAKSDTEGTASGDKMAHRKIIFMGGGGAGGAILGAAVGGGWGALIGAGAGAAGGWLGEKMIKGEQATVKSGTEFGIVLNQTAYFQRFTELTDAPERTPVP